jgi:hypothetical protein
MADAGSIIAFVCMGGAWIDSVDISDKKAKLLNRLPWAQQP